MGFSFLFRNRSGYTKEQNIKAATECCVSFGSFRRPPRWPGPTQGHLHHVYFICSSWGSHFRVVTGRRLFSPPSCQPLYGLTVLHWSAGDHASEDGRAHLLVSLRCLSGNTICVSVSLYSFLVMVGCGRDVFLIVLES